MSNTAWADEVKRICPLAAQILTAVGLPPVVEDAKIAVEPGFRIHVLAGADDSALLEISHGLPGEELIALQKAWDEIVAEYYPEDEDDEEGNDEA